MRAWVDIIWTVLVTTMYIFRTVLVTKPSKHTKKDRSYLALKKLWQVSSDVVEYSDEKILAILTKHLQAYHIHIWNETQLLHSVLVELESLHQL